MNTATRTTGRSAGILYLLTGLPGVVAYMYLPNTFIVSDDAAATARHIADATLTYRLGILCDLVGQIFLVVLALNLYALFKGVDKRYARLMVALAAMGATVQIANVLNLIAPLIVLSGDGFLSVFTTPQLDALALAFLHLRSEGLLISQLFWGLWLFPFGMLVIRSGYFPKTLGVLLIVACCAYVVHSVVHIVLPTHAHLLSHLAALFGGLGEGAMIVWLLAKGANAPAVQPAGASD